MRKILGFVLAFGALSLTVGAVDLTWDHSLQKGSGQELTRTYKHLTEPLPCRSVATDGFTIERPAFKAALGKGTLLAEVDGAGVVRGLYYQGNATISFEVADPVERAHLKLFLGQESIQNQPVDSFYILPLGNGSGLPTVPEGALTLPDQPEYGRFKNALHVNGIALTASLLDAQLQGNEDLQILFRLNGSIWSYVLDSTAEEEVSLRRLGTPPRVDFWWWDATVSLHRDGSGNLIPTQTRREMDIKNTTDALHYDVHLVLNSDGAAQVGSGVAIQAKLLKPVRALQLLCNPILDVSRVTLNGTQDLPFIKEAYSSKYFFMEPDLVVLLPENTQGDVKLDIEYTGDLCEPVFGFTSLKFESDWYPSIPDMDGATYSFSASVPNGYEAVGVGDLVSSRAEGDRTVFTYELKEKAWFTTFLFGKFKHTKRTAEGIEIDVALPDNYKTIYINQNRDTVAKEVEDAITYYTKLYGPLPYKTVHVGLAGGHTNLGFPTLILLTASVFTRSDLASWPEQVVPHEVAHQWWGNQVAPLTYRDAWMSEALAEFSSYLYLFEYKGIETLKLYLSTDFHGFAQLSAIRRQPYIDFGPICLGNRLETTLDWDDSYEAVVYEKGAWILLGLTRLATATKAGESGFYDGLKDLLSGMKNERVTAADLQQALERHMKVPLAWYFKQWLGYTGMPKVSIKTHVEGTGPGATIVVEGMQDSQLLLAIPIQAVQGKSIREYLFFLKPGGSKAEFPVPFKPDRVVIDANCFSFMNYQK